MAPTIRIDDEVFERLQQLAKPFVDTPNSVMRRELGLAEQPDSNGRRGRSAGGRKRAHPDDLLPGQDYYMPILQTLAEQEGGMLRSRDVVATVGRKLEGKLKPMDYEENKSGAIRWENRTAWAANALKSAGLLARRRDGMWELTEAGLESAKSGNVPEATRGARSRNRLRGKPADAANGDQL